MSAPDDDTEKTHEATPRKLEEARKKGEVPRSTDLSVAASYGGLLIAALIFGPASLQGIGQSLMVLIEQAPDLSKLVFEGAPQAPMGGVFKTVGQSMLPWFLLPATVVLLTILAQRAFLVTPDKLKFKLSRISPISNAKNKYGRNGLFEFSKSFAKLIIYSVCLALFLKAKLPEMVGSLQASPGMAVIVLSRLALGFLFIAFTIAIAIGAIDYLWQHAEHLRKNRMSRKDLTDEAKEAEGDPHLKQKRRQRAYEIANSQMMRDVPDADVVIVNPTHFAVALKWSRQRGDAPICVAKGVDETAARIRTLAQESSVPVHSDPPTARALYASVEVGDEITPEHYRAVAAAIRFAEALRKRVWRSR